MRGEKDTRPCANCGTLLTRYLSQARGEHWYCDATCQASHQPAAITISKEPNPFRGQTDTRPCAECGAPVTRRLSQRRLAQVWTCSRTCLGKYMSRKRMAEGPWQRPNKPRRGTSTPCPVCGTDVYRSAKQIAEGTRRYCSKACADIAHTKTPVIKHCLTCGKELVLKPSQASIKYCSQTCMAVGMTKRPMDRTHNGRKARKDQNGYVMVYEPDHPNKAFHGWQYEHRLVAEQAIGRYLRSDEAVHHKNGQKDDNRPENLEVMDLNEHATMSVQDYRDDLNRKLARLAAYERRYGPLKE